MKKKIKNDEFRIGFCNVYLRINKDPTTGKGVKTRSVKLVLLDK